MIRRSPANLKGILYMILMTAVARVSDRFTSSVSGSNFLKAWISSSQSIISIAAWSFKRWDLGRPTRASLCTKLPDIPSSIWFMLSTFLKDTEGGLPSEPVSEPVELSWELLNHWGATLSDRSRFDGFWALDIFRGWINNGCGITIQETSVN